MSNSLDALDLKEPDEAFLLAAEAEVELPAQPCALAVLISDHKRNGAIDEGSDQLVFELLQEMGYKVDACTSRGICGVSGSTVVVNLAPSRAAIRDGMSTIAPLVAHLISELRKYSVQ